ncbi:MAG: nucleotidyltransferase domain-containing protein [Thermoproteota archaeon]
MPRRSKDLLKRYLEARRRALSERPAVLKEFLEKLASALGDKASIMVFGGRAVHGIETTEPRDLDILVVVEDGEDPSTVEELAYSLKPKTLPVDIIVARKRELKSPVVREMLRHRVVVHDPLNAESLLSS